jgi:hypothetical protein
MAQVRSLSAVFVLVSGLPAQQYLVVPNDRLTVRGNAIDSRPFGFDRVRHEQYIGRSQLVPLGTQAMIRGVAYRPDAGQTGIRVDQTAGNPGWSVRMGNVTVNAGGPGTGAYVSPANLTAVFLPRAISWPTWTMNGNPAPMPFMLSFPFDVPFPYTGGHLVISHYSFNTAMQVAFNYYFDAERPDAGVGQATRFGSGCPAGSNDMTGFAPSPGGGDLTLYVHGAPPQAPVMALLGTSRSSYAGVRLPLDLGPVGLTGCSLYTNPVMLLPGTVEASGIGHISAAVPADPSLAGTNLFAQFLVTQDTRVSPQLGLTTSAALDLVFGAAVGARAIEMATVSGTLQQANGAGGILFPGEGLVVRIQY